MNSLNTDTILDALRHVTDRDTGTDVVSLGMISGVAIRGDKVGFLISIDAADKDRKSYLRDECERTVRALPGVASVTAVLTAQNPTPIPPKPESGYNAPRERATWNLTPVQHVRSVVAVASGKGGVGKSTTTVNIALALQALGLRVGVLDADIYGPSVPRMLGLSGQPLIVDGKMQPLVRYGISTMSMGYITGEEAAILRGPMISKTLHQLLRMTTWATVNEQLDVLLVDMPPGTGDIHLSMVQQVPLSGAIIVTTPQEVATIDARKCAQMFRKTGTRLLGVVENMSYFTDAAGNRIALFGEGGGAALSGEFNVPLLGQIPMDTALRAASDEGTHYSGLCDAAYSTIAQQLKDALDS
jgi:ATP-binding protein involved in chromosome partitioning